MSDSHPYPEEPQLPQPSPVDAGRAPAYSRRYFCTPAPERGLTALGNRRNKGAHVAVAENAMGRLMPPKAEVHHVNKIGTDNRPENLVVCQDHAYHKLLHQRERALRGCGNPAWRKCNYCQTWDDAARLKRSNGKDRMHYHASCANAARRARRKAVAS